MLITGNASAHEGGSGEPVSEWIVHAASAGINLILIIGIAIAGRAITGKSRFKLKNAFGIHKILTLLFSVVIVITFLLGITITSSHGEAILNSPHGLIGLTLVVLALMALTNSPCITKSKRRTRIHSMLGYIIGVLVVLQIILGISMVIT